MTAGSAGGDRVRSQAFGNNLAAAESRSRGTSIAREGGACPTRMHSALWGVRENGNEMSAVIMGAVLYQAPLPPSRHAGVVAAPLGLPRSFSSPAAPASRTKFPRVPTISSERALDGLRSPRRVNTL